MGWLGDLFRTAWGLLYWNLRKSLFRLRGRRDRCPCQIQSDSGQAWETGCEAAVSWNRQARFRRVCPLLKPLPDGRLRCSVNAEDVRPFWGRAFLISGGTTLALYLTAVLAVFAVMRGIGYRLTPWTLAWPPAWSTLRTVRSNFFLDKARVANEEQRINEAILSLSLAYELDPSNHEAGLLLAQLWQVGQMALSDRTYVRLLDHDPARRPQTAQAWYRALLARGDYRAIAHLSADALRFDPGRSAAWMHALFFAVQRTGDYNPIDRALAYVSPPLQPDIKALLELERSISTLIRPQAIERLLRPPVDPGTPYSAYYRVDRLLRMGAHQEALALLEQFGPRIGERERVALQLDLYARLGWNSLRRSTVEAIIARPLSLPVVELLCAHLIRHPDAELTQLFLARQKAEPLPMVEANYPGYLAMYCLAGLQANTPELSSIGDGLRQITRTGFVSLRAAEAFFRQPTTTRRIESVLPLLQPMPVEVSYALLDRLGRPPERPASP